MSEKAFRAAVKQAREMLRIDMPRPLDNGLVWAEDRIKELTSLNAALDVKYNSAQQSLDQVTAENQRLRDGVQNILLHTLRNGNYTHDVQLANDLLGSIERQASALLGGGE